MTQHRVTRPVKPPARRRAERETEQHDSTVRPEVRKDVWDRWFKER